MSITSFFRPLDLLKITNVNLDQFTETYHMNFYLHYIVKWPEYMKKLVQPTLTCVKNAAQDSKSFSPTKIMGYMIAKSEGSNHLWHGHVTALSVAPEYRRLGFASKLILDFENTSNNKDCHFADLFVRESNLLAQELYTKLGYIIYRKVLNYYDGEESAFDMHKALLADKERKSMRPWTRPIYPEQLEFS